MLDVALKLAFLVAVLLAYELGYLRGRNGKDRW